MSKTVSHNDISNVDVTVPVIPVNGTTSKQPSTPDPDSSSSNRNGVAQNPKLDLNKYRIDQNYTALLATKKRVVTVPVGRPHKNSWVYFHPDRAWRMPVMVLSDKTNNRVYVCDPAIVPEVAEDLAPKLLCAYMTATGNPGLWDIRLPKEDGRIDSYSESALIIATEHSGKWVRVRTDEEQKNYYILECDVVPPSPKWPESFAWMFDIAFRGREINSLEHPVLQGLRGRMTP